LIPNVGSVIYTKSSNLLAKHFLTPKLSVVLPKKWDSQVLITRTPKPYTKNIRDSPPGQICISKAWTMYRLTNIKPFNGPTINVGKQEHRVYLPIMISIPRPGKQLSIARIRTSKANYRIRPFLLF